MCNNVCAFSVAWRAVIRWDNMTTGSVRGRVVVPSRHQPSATRRGRPPATGPHRLTVAHVCRPGTQHSMWPNTSGTKRSPCRRMLCFRAHPSLGSDTRSWWSSWRRQRARTSQRLCGFEVSRIGVCASRRSADTSRAQHLAVWEPKPIPGSLDTTPVTFPKPWHAGQRPTTPRTRYKLEHKFVAAVLPW